MPLLIGMDEAGLGPNLGPFVVAVTVWDVPSPVSEFDFWATFESVLSRSPGSCDPRLHVADSKQVFQSGRGIGALERGVQSALTMSSIVAATFRELCRKLAPTPLAPSSRAARRETPGYRWKSLFDDNPLSDEALDEGIVSSKDGFAEPPWYREESLTLPVESADETFVEPWRLACKRSRVRLVAVGADVVEPSRFNALVRQYDNKSGATSRLAMNLLKQHWNPQQDAESLVVADKHGGRNRYQPLLEETFPESSVVIDDEGANLSSYRIGAGTIRFQPRAEEYGPVAVASMLAKYLRELAMHQFNRYWADHVPGLKPTQGYPVDAKRFRTEIESVQRQLGIPDETLWRER